MSLDQECIFCKIVIGEIPCAKLYETVDFLSFLDIAPTKPGHALVIPKSHHTDLFDLPSDLASKSLEVIQYVGQGVMQATAAEGLNVMMNNFEAAGQLVSHVHWHLIPRHATDGLELWPQHSYDNEEAMQELAEAISLRLK